MDCRNSLIRKKETVSFLECECSLKTVIFEPCRLSLSSTDADSTLNVNHLCNNGDVAIIGELYGNVAQLSGTGTHDIHLRKNSYRR